MNGQKSLEDIEKKYTEYEKGLVLSKLKCKDVEEIDLSPEHLATLSAEETYDLSLNLQNQSLRMQKELNKHIAIVRWLNNPSDIRSRQSQYAIDKMSYIPPKVDQIAKFLDKYADRKRFNHAI